MIKKEPIRPRSQSLLRPAAYRFLEKSPVQMTVIARDGKIIYMNAAARRIAGTTQKKLQGRDFFSFFPQPEPAREIIDKALRKGSAEAQLMTWQAPTGRRLELEFSLSRIDSTDGTVAGIFSVSRDLSKERALQRRMGSASRYARSLIEACLDPLVTISTEGKIMDVNRATELATGHSRETLIGSDFSNYFTNPDKAREAYLQVFSRGYVNDFPLTLRHTSGSEIDVLYNASVYHDDEGNLAGVFASARDVTQLTRSQRELEQANHEVTLLSEMNGLLQSCSSEDEAVPIISATLEKLFPKTRGRIFIIKPEKTVLVETCSWGTSSWEKNTLAPADCWALRRGKMHDVGFQDSLNPPCRALGSCKNYLCLPLQAHGHSLGIIQIVFDGLELPPLGKQHARQLATAAGDNISLALANLQLRESLHSLSIHDSLTGLYNRRFMEEELDRETSHMARLNKKMAVAMIDIDHFKEYNDSYGHEAGDAVMKAIADLMHSFRHGSDIACRFGGEEFVVIMPEAGAEDAVHKMEEFRSSVARLRTKLNGQPLPATAVSVGLAIFPEHGHTPADLLKQADSALYHAKEMGRNRVELADSHFPTPAATAA